MLIPFDVIVRKYNMLIHGVLHIGAHRCEELIHYRNYGLTNDKIIWIEANPRLVQNIRRMDKTIIIKNFICCDRDTGITRLTREHIGILFYLDMSLVYKFVAIFFTFFVIS